MVRSFLAINATIKETANNLWEITPDPNMKVSDMLVIIVKITLQRKLVFWNTSKTNMKESDTSVINATVYSNNEDLYWDISKISTEWLSLFIVVNEILLRSLFLISNKTKSYRNKFQLYQHFDTEPLGTIRFFLSNRRLKLGGILWGLLIRRVLLWNISTDSAGGL